MGGEQDETPAVQEELPPGTEDLSDPAKVQIQFNVQQEILTFLTSCMQGLSEACHLLNFLFFLVYRRLVQALSFFVPGAKARTKFSCCSEVKTLVL